MATIPITEQLAIPEQELTFTASRSSGPGGQHVNKAATRVMLRFNVVASPSLSAEQKQRILARLATRVSKDGILRVVAQQYRSQEANRRAATARFAALLRQALAPETPRKPTTVPLAAKHRRLEAKKRRSRVKQQRAYRPVWDE